MPDGQDVYASFSLILASLASISCAVSLLFGLFKVSLAFLRCKTEFSTEWSYSRVVISLVASSSEAFHPNRPSNVFLEVNREIT